MIGLYYLNVLALWIFITFIFIRGVRRLAAEKNEIRLARTIAGLCFLILWLGFSFWFSGGRKYYYDYRLEQFCALDGGTIVYEYILLPSDKFDERGDIKFFKATEGEGAFGSDYTYKMNMEYLHGDPNEEFVTFRVNHKIYLRSSGKLMGESTRYYRRGGDLPGPSHPSSFSCPDGDISLSKRIFVNQENSGAKS